MWDIALIKLNDKFPKKTDGMQYVLNPVCLPARDRIPSTRKELSTIYGYGVIYDKDAWIFKETTPDFFAKSRPLCTRLLKQYNVL